MVKIRFLLTNVLFWVIILLCSLLVENIAFFTPNIREGFDTNSFSVITVALGLLSLFYLICEHRRNKLKVHFVWLFGFLVFFAINIFVIWRTPSEMTLTNEEALTSVTFSITFKEKLFASIQLGVSMLVMYLIIYPYKRNHISLLVKRWIYWIVVIAVLVFIGISIYTDFDSYKEIISFTNDEAYVKSLFPNPNFFGMIIMLAIMAMAILQIDKPHWYVTIFMIVFAFMGLFTKCLATNLVSLAIIVIYFIYNTIASMKRHLVRSLLYLFFFVIITFSTIVTFALLYRYNFEPVVTFLDYAVRAIRKEMNTYSSFNGRIALWQSAMNMVKGDWISLWLGSGYKIGPKIFHYQIMVNLNPTIGEYEILSAHSTFFEMLIRGGIIGTVLYYSTAVYFLIEAIYLFVKKKRRYAFIFALCYIGLTLHGLVETAFFFDGNVIGLLYTTLFFAPVISEAYYTKKKRQTEIQIFKENSPYFRQKLNHHLTTQSIATVIVGIMVMGISVYLSPYAYIGRHAKLLALVLLLLLISLIFIPYLITLWSKNSSPRRFVVRLLINIPILLGINGVLGYFIYNLANDIYLYTLVPAIYFVTLLIEMIIYFPSVRGSFKDWFLDTIKGTFVNNRITLLAMVFIVVIISLTISNNLLEVGLLSALITSTIVGLLYFALVILIPNNNKKRIINHLNDQAFATLRRKMLQQDLKKL